MTAESPVNDLLPAESGCERVLAHVAGRSVPRVRGYREGACMRKRLIAGAAAALAAGSLAVVVVLNTGPALAAPATPDFGPAIDNYAVYQPQTTCSSTIQPGVGDFRDLLNATYGRRDISTVRPCGSERQSEHMDGRALDFGLNVSNPTERAYADEILGWLHATDRHGNRHALARRFGIMYIIWNDRIWSAHRQSEGWRDYTGQNPHTDHIHVSFGWPGALRQTTWWTSGNRDSLEASGAVAGRNADGRMEIFGRNTHGGIMTAYQTQPNGTWSGWVDLGGTNLVSTPTVGNNADGRMEIFARNGNGGIMTAYQTQPNGTWSGWVDLGGLIA
jgi:hypothetical protein